MVQPTDDKPVTSVSGDDVLTPGNSKEDEFFRDAPSPPGAPSRSKTPPSGSGEEQPSTKLADH